MAMRDQRYFYKCPILEDMGAYDEEYPCGKYDPRHYDNLDQMVKHLKQNKWTVEEIDAWVARAVPFFKEDKRSLFRAI